MSNAPMLLPDDTDNLQQSEETYYESSLPPFTSFVSEFQASCIYLYKY